MNDIDALLARLREVARAQSPGTSGSESVEARAWFPAQNMGVRDALVDAWSGSSALDLVPFLVSDDDDFVALAFVYFVGRLPDPEGRNHYLGLLQQRRPRLEALAHLRSSPEATRYRGKPRLPLWLHVLLRTMRMPMPLARRGGRYVLRRIERRLASRARVSPKGLVWRLASATDDQNAKRDRDLDRISGDLRAIARDFAAHASATGDRASAAERRLSQHESALAAVRARMAVLDHDRANSGQRASSHSTTEGGPAAAVPAADSLTRYYLSLEAAFRGDPANIRRQLESDYLGFVIEARAEAGDGPCVDLGCGRGEWLDVLRANGFTARGVDLNPYMAAEAQARGHDVVVADAVSFLRAMPEASALAISAFHLAEHLEFETLYAFIGEARRVLKPGGRLLLETPNPENVWVATHTFHHDPSHRNPLTPASLEFLVNHHGLQTVAVPRLHPYPEDTFLPGHDPASERLNGMTCGPQDFGVIARKTAPS